jgi:hypothetical protein
MWKLVLDSYPGKAVLSDPKNDQQTKVPSKPDIHINISSSASSLVESVTSKVQATTRMKEEQSDKVPKLDDDLKQELHPAKVNVPHLSPKPTGYKPKFQIHQDDLSVSPKGGQGSNNHLPSHQDPMIGSLTFSLSRRI